MYKVIYWEKIGGEKTKKFNNIDEACNFALQKRYCLQEIVDSNEDTIFNRAEDLGNGYFTLKRIIKPI